MPKPLCLSKRYVIFLFNWTGYHVFLEEIKLMTQRPNDVRATTSGAKYSFRKNYPTFSNGDATIARSSAPKTRPLSHLHLRVLITGW